MGKKDDQEIEAVLRKDPTRWLSTGELGDELPNIKKPNLYVSVSNLTIKEKVLQRRKRIDGAGYEYQLTENVIVQPRSEPTIPHTNNTNPPPPDLQQAPAQKPKWVPPPTTTMRDTMRDALKEAYKDIEWSDEEKLLIASQYVRIKKLRTWLAPNEALREAQKVLPVSRQYKVPLDKASLPWFDEFIQKSVIEENKPTPINASTAEARDNDFRQKMAQTAVVTHKVGKTIENPTAPSRPVVTRADPPEVAPIVDDHLPPEPEPRVVEVPLDITSLATSAIMDEIMKRATAALTKIVVDVFSSPQVKEALTIKVAVNLNTVQKPPAATTPLEVPKVETMAEPAAAERRHVEERRHVDLSPPVAERPHKKRILIAGLLNAQQREIANEFSGALDVRFWKTDDSINTLKSRAGQADYTILVQDFLGGSHVKAIENLGVKFYRHKGGMTKLKDVLTGIYVNDENVMKHIR